MSRCSHSTRAGAGLLLVLDSVWRSSQVPVTSRPRNATKDSPWENSLGMKFVPVAGHLCCFASGIRACRISRHS